MSTNLYIGLISGTSMDGIDCALVDLPPGQGLRVLDYHCAPLPAPLRDTLLALCANQGLDLIQLGNADVAVAEHFADAVLQLLAKRRLKPAQVAAIGSHGQTLWHQPPQRGSDQPAFTLQIGDPNIIAARTGITTVADFRRRDMAHGGQGAPIVPALHQALFQQPGRTTVVLNLGGIANITVLPGNDSPPFGFDTGPANVLMDAWIGAERQLAFDADGAWAATGQVQVPLLARLLDEPYLAQAAPKSTGRELFNLPWLQAQLRATGTAYQPEDVQATLLEYTALSVRDAIVAHAGDGELIVCGGGAHNQTLLQRLQTLLPGFALTTSASHGLDPDCVEATAFAWFAGKTLQRERIDFSPFTGADGAVIAGGVYFV